jgi:chemotaxis protein MotA
VLLSYGVLNPVATNIEVAGAASAKYLRCIKDGVVASQRGTSPIVAIEFARKALFGNTRPTSDELDEAVRGLKAS